MPDLRSSALAGFVGIAVGVLGLIHGLGPVHAKSVAPVVASAPAPQVTALGAAAAHIVVARAR